MAFYINGTERAYRAEILASAASDTALGIYGRNLYSIGCVRINRYHGYRSCRAMSCTIAAMHSFSRCDTPLRQPYRMTCLYGCAFFLLYWNNCSCRTRSEEHTSELQSVIQSWHAVHRVVKFLWLIEPGGVILTRRLGFSLSAAIGASPPSTLFS